MNARRRSDNTWPRTIRAMVSHETAPSPTNKSGKLQQARLFVRKAVRAGLPFRQHGVERRDQHDDENNRRHRIEHIHKSASSRCPIVRRNNRPPRPTRTPMTRLTAAPTMPTSSEMRAPWQTRLKRSRPCASVPNQCSQLGGANCASEMRVGRMRHGFGQHGGGGRKPELNSGQTKSARSNPSSTSAPPLAPRLRRNRRHAL
jgi:hypothetical protein